MVTFSISKTGVLRKQQKQQQQPSMLLVLHSRGIAYHATYSTKAQLACLQALTGVMCGYIHSVALPATLRVVLRVVYILHYSFSFKLNPQLVVLTSCLYHITQSLPLIAQVIPIIPPTQECVVDTGISK